MTLIVLLAILLGGCLWLRRPCLEITLGSLFAGPVLLYGVGPLIGAETGSTWLVLAITLGIAYYLTRHTENLLPRSEEWLTAIALLVSYLFFYRLSLLWPDFVSIGERLRDYAILAATYRNPLEVPEPWMSGTGLNYYVYWYRFGQFLGSLFNEPVWAIYHQLAAFSLAAYFACCFRLLLSHFSFSPAISTLGALVIACGSNLAGIRHFLTRDANWWGPSRVIDGAINEFPAWSFLLGDLHPHYLNLCVLPLMTSVVLLLVRRGWSLPGAALGFLAWGVLVPFWLYAANAWELPIWAIFSGWIGAGLAVAGFLALFRMGPGPLPSPAALLPGARSAPLVVGVLLTLGLAAILYESTLHLQQPENFKLEWVAPPISRSPLIALLQHWGVQIALLTLGLLVAERNIIMAIVGALIIGLGIFGSTDALLALALLVVIATIQRVSSLAGRLDAHLSKNGTDVVACALPLAFLSLVIFPEVAFVNDAYGNDIERMNTIFKFYSAAWWMSWMAVLVVGREALARIPAFITTPLQSVPRWVALSFATLLLLGFFYRTIPLRRTERFSNTPFSQGLSTLDQRFPGSAETIRRLSTLPDAVVLEAQGNAYDVTSFVSTLSGQQSFLGWGNHVGLLTGKYPEVQRREQFTESWYRETDCEKRKAMLAAEGITHAVIGSLEKQRYGEQTGQNLACLREFVRSDQYVVVMP